MRGDSAIKVFLGLLGLGFLIACAWNSAGRAIAGMNDFPPFYVAAGLAGSDAIWDSEPYYRFLDEQFGVYGESLVWIRPPFYALLLKPLSWFEFETAYGLWWALRLAAVALFVAIWPVGARADTMMFACLSLPVFACLFNGQDGVFLLPPIALAVRSTLRQRGVAREPDTGSHTPLTQGAPNHIGGAALSLCSIKFHLFFPLPLLLLARREKALAIGTAVGGVVLIALSFAASPGWLASYFDLLTQGKIHPGASSMPNLHGLLWQWPVAEWAATTAVLVGCWFSFRRADLADSFAICLIGGLLVSRHAYVADCVLVLPAALVLINGERPAALRLGAMLLLWPPLYLMLLSGGALTQFAQLYLTAFWCGATAHACGLFAARPVLSSSPHGSP